MTVPVFDPSFFLKDAPFVAVGARIRKASNQKPSFPTIRKNVSAAVAVLIRVQSRQSQKTILFLSIDKIVTVVSNVLGTALPMR
jgi:hypothetical protein